MKTDSPNPPPDGPSTSGSARPADMGNATQVIDLAEVELLVAQQSLDSSRDLAAQSRSERSLPPPLPVDARASAVPAQMQSLVPVPAAPRSNAFFIVAILAFLVLGVGGGLVIAIVLRRPTAPAPAPAVITIPTVEMNDTDAGGK